MSLETRHCESHELGLNRNRLADEEHLIFWPYQGSLLELEHFKSHFRCIEDLASVKLQGKYDSDQGSRLEISLELCDRDKPGCDEKVDVAEWLEDKYIAFLVNEKVFRPSAEESEDEMLKEVATMHWVPASSQVRTTY